MTIKKYTKEELNKITNARGTFHEQNNIIIIGDGFKKEYIADDYFLGEFLNSWNFRDFAADNKIDQIIVNDIEVDIEVFYQFMYGYIYGIESPEEVEHRKMIQSFIM